MNRKLLLMIGLLAATVAGTVPARAVDVTRALPSDPLATATVAANSYVAWDLHVPEAGPFDIVTVGAAANKAMVLYVRTDAPGAAGHTVGDPVGSAGAFGFGSGLPGAAAGTGGADFDAGDYTVVGAVGGTASAARFSLVAPKGTSVRAVRRGRTIALSDSDFGGVGLVAPGVDERSIHGSVTIPVRHTLFAMWTQCAGASHTVTPPPAAAHWPWAFAGGVSWGQAGDWTLTLDTQANTIQPGSTTIPCTNDLVGVDLDIPATAIPKL